ncbi:MAG: arylesterase [Rhodobacteraceae bacterium]|nr:arylesterase [Paracoccaceae bacterium]
MRKTLAGLIVAAATSAAAEPIAIAALGDSLIQGYGLPIEDGFVPQLETWLEAHGADVDLINAGVSGDTTAGGAARVAWTLTPEVDGMIVALGGNDLLRGLSPAEVRANLATILDAAHAADVDVLLIGFAAPLNYGPDYKAEFDAIYPDLSAAYETLFLESFFVGLPGIGTDPEAMQAFVQPDGLHPNAAGVARIVSGVGPAVLELVAQASREDS